MNGYYGLFPYELPKIVVIGEDKSKLVNEEILRREKEQGLMEKRGEKLSSSPTFAARLAPKPVINILFPSLIREEKKPVSYKTEEFKMNGYYGLFPYQLPKIVVTGEDKSKLVNEEILRREKEQELMEKRGEKLSSSPTFAARLAPKPVMVISFPSLAREGTGPSYFPDYAMPVIKLQDLLYPALPGFVYSPEITTTKPPFVPGMKPPPGKNHIFPLIPTIYGEKYTAEIEYTPLIEPEKKSYLWLIILLILLGIAGLVFGAAKYGNPGGWPCVEV